MGVRFAAFLLAALALPAGSPAGHAPTREKIQIAAEERSYYLFIPDSLATARPAPVLVLLHGSFSNGMALLGEWMELADREGIILVAPNSLDERHWQIRRDGPAFLSDVLDSVAARRPIDRLRLYLFGHSGGAAYALTLAMLESEFFAAAAIHAGAWRERSEFALAPHARRKIPVALFVGDRDRFFSVASVKKTAAAIEKAGHAVAVTVIRRHGHDYAGVAAEVNREAWDFLKGTSLSQASRLQSIE